MIERDESLVQLSAVENESPTRTEGDQVEPQRAPRVDTVTTTDPVVGKLDEATTANGARTSAVRAAVRLAKGRVEDERARAVLRPSAAGVFATSTVAANQIVPVETEAEKAT